MVKINREYNLLPFVVVVVMIRGFLLVGEIFICGFHLKSESLNFIGFEMNGFEVIFNVFLGFMLQCDGDTNKFEPSDRFLPSHKNIS